MRMQPSTRGGSPNSGKSFSVPRKNVSSTIRPSAQLQHLQRPRLVAARPRWACTGRTPASRLPRPSGSHANPGIRYPARTTR